MQSDLTCEKYPVIRVYPDQLLIFEKFTTDLPRSERQIENEKNLTRGEYNGFMSPKTKSKVRKYLSSWIESGLYIAKSIRANELDKVPYFTFVTLTLPSMQFHDDKIIKRKCLTPFIEHLKESYDVKHYFWRAESQQNGNIHFHLIVDSFIDWRLLRNDWNKCVNKLGYVDKYTEKHKLMSLSDYLSEYLPNQHHTTEDRIKAYNKGKSTNWSDPNSTDIHSLKHVNNPASYLIKYCCKSDGYRKIDGRIHGCSDGIKSLSPYEDFMDVKTSEFVEKCKIIEDDDYMIIKCNTNYLINKYYPNLLKELSKHKIAQAFQLYSTAPPPIIQKYIDKRERKKLIQLELFGSWC